MTTFLLTLLVLAAGAGGAGRVYWLGRHVVPVGHVGIVRRVRGGQHIDAAFQHVVPYDARGVLARTLLPLRPIWLNPWFYTVEYVPRLHVPDGMLGVVTAREGRQRPTGRSVALLPEGVDCRQFQDGQTFLLKGGEMGPQAVTLPGGTYYSINTELFDVQIVPRTYVPDGTVGLVRAKAGRVRQPGRPFAAHVPCDDFQDGAAFLRGGGEMGPQYAVLAGGTYYDINPELFDVITVDNIGADEEGVTAAQLRATFIPMGHVGVVITADGAEPAPDEKLGPVVAGHRNFQLPWVFVARKGRRGVQQEILAEGSVCTLNPWFVSVLLVPTYLLNMEWNKKDAAKKGNYDARLDQLAVMTSQGIRLWVEVSQSLRIPPAVAPRLVSEFGSNPDAGRSAAGAVVDDPQPVQRFVERVLGATVETYFVEITANSTVKEFLSDISEVRTNLSSQVRNALKAWGVEAVRTNIERVTAMDEVYYDERQKVFKAENKGDVLEKKQENTAIEIEIELRKMVVEKKRLVLAIEAEAELLGLGHARFVRVIEEMSKLPVPSHIGGDLAGYLESLPMNVVRNVLERMQGLHMDTVAEVGDAAVADGTAAEVVESGADDAGEAAPDAEGAGQ
ncbi:SPFH domain-containing protein [Actinomadura rayongensis]|uniref:Band 7 domain-containing protein n=1 Tax=Actinomadura rayongensis TaxID=1429076 RepID=A0A6I4W668_9ACTN|nr:SPFH domain-containing protein [Actinomadura rayongensis]MXQ65038.1 hypothetical protein [Actinomadura rayongensis]